MSEQKIFRALLFFIFFAAGAAALGISILVDELMDHYQGRALVRQAESRLDDLESLNADYEALLEHIEKDPDLIRRVAPVVIGADRDANESVAFPRAKSELLKAAEDALSADSESLIVGPGAPGWLERCTEPRRRFLLFLSGAVLILIAFVFFGSSNDRVLKRSAAKEFDDELDDDLS